MKLMIELPDNIYKELTESAVIVTDIYPATIEKALTEAKPIPQGRWILDSMLNNRCSVCKCITTDISVTKPPFCQWCGAEMEIDK